MSHAAWPEESTRAMPLSEFDERFRRYRLSVPEAERALVDSLKRYGQMAPVVVCVCDGEFLLIDGFKRLAAARSIKGFDTLRARSIECDERSAKAALDNLNRVGRGVQEVESGAAESDSGAPTGAVARGQPGRGIGGGSPRIAHQRRTAWNR